MKCTCTLTKVENNHNKLRDDVIHGHCDAMPTLNKCFLMYGEGKEFGIRRVNTSPIKSIQRDGWNFKVTTESGSIYHISLQ